MNTMTFLGFCSEHHIKILRDDLRFIRDCLNKIPPKAHRSVLRHYCEEWLVGMDDWVNGVQNQNNGRRRANKWLLRQCGEKN
jgi:hypothetical protein